MRSHLCTFFLAFLMLLPLPSWAAEKPPELSQSIQNMEPIGTAKMRKFLLHVYDASFWSDRAGWSQAPYALSITYAMNFSAQELAERTLSEMQHVSDLPRTTLMEYANRLAKLWPDIKDGDRLTALALADGSTRFFHNGRHVGTLRDPQFAPAFFGIWLSPRSSEPSMRKQLLNQ